MRKHVNAPVLLLWINMNEAFDEMINKIGCPNQETNLSETHRLLSITPGGIINMDNNNPKVIGDFQNEFPKLQSACSKCVGYIKNCDNCGQKIEILNHRPLNYHEGSLHRPAVEEERRYSFQSYGYTATAKDKP